MVKFRQFSPAESAARCRQMRNDCQMTQEQWAAKLGTSFTTVSRWENGKTRPSPIFADQIVRVWKRHRIPKED